MTDRKTVAGAYAKIDKHEDECAIRYGHISETLGDLWPGGVPLSEGQA